MTTTNNSSEAKQTNLTKTTAQQAKKLHGRDAIDELEQVFGYVDSVCYVMRLCALISIAALAVRRARVPLVQDAMTMTICRAQITRQSYDARKSQLRAAKTIALGRIARANERTSVCQLQCQFRCSKRTKSHRGDSSGHIFTSYLLFFYIFM